MTDRITDKHLEHLVDRINEVTGSPRAAYTKGADGKYTANIGNYHIDHAYGGVSLERMVNDGGGVTTPLGLGHVPKRELYNVLRAYLTGLEQRNDKAA